MPANVVVERRYSYQTSAELLTHWAVLAVRDAMSQRLGRQPTIVVLTRTNGLAARVSEALAQKQITPNGTVLPSVDHVLSWDPELTAASALVVASVMEWPYKERSTAVTDSLRHLVDYYRTKLGNGTQGAKAKIVTLERSIVAIGEGRTPAAKAAKVLLERFDSPTDLTGQPVRDWQAARARLSGSAELEEVFRQARLLRLLRATDAIAWALMESWDGVGSYRRAADVVRVALAEEAVNMTRQDPPLVSVMTMHKSKGKEFDAVVILEGRHQGQLFSEDPKDHDADRRLLRVAITRARHMTMFVRPAEFPLLIPAPSP
jgi:DNA helicase-2/ATP-dependent DNA helicase PcrA